MDDKERIEQTIKTGKESRRTVIDMSEKIMERANAARLKSIERLLKHAESLDW